MFIHSIIVIWRESNSWILYNACRAVKQLQELRILYSRLSNKSLLNLRHSWQYLWRLSSNNQNVRHTRPAHHCAIIESLEYGLLSNNHYYLAQLKSVIQTFSFLLSTFVYSTWSRVFVSLYFNIGSWLLMLLFVRHLSSSLHAHKH